MAKHPNKIVASKKRRPSGTKSVKTAMNVAPLEEVQAAEAAPTENEAVSKGGVAAGRSSQKQSGVASGTAAEAATRAPLPSPLALLKISLRVLGQRWKLFACILLVYAVLNVLFVQTIGSFDTSGVKHNLDQLFGGSSAKLSSATALFTYMLGATNSSTSGGSVYELVLIIITSLAIIRALREVYDGRLPRARQAFYEGMFPLAPFVLVLLLVGLELVPMTIGASLYSLVMSNGIAIYFIEKLLWLAAFLGLSAVSLYLIASSLMALYITTQRGMTPMRAIRAARKVTRGRHWRIVLRLLFLPVALALASAVIIIPAILAVPGLAAIITFIGAMVGLSIIHSYLFALLRSVLA